MKTSSKGYFDEVAGQWDGMRESFFPGAVREKALSVADVRPGKRAADIGAGTGFIAEALIRRWFLEAGLGQVIADCVNEDCCAESASGDKAAVSIFIASGKR